MRFQRQLLIALATTVVAACAKDVKGVSNVGDIPPLAYVRYLNAVSDTLGTDFRSIDHLTYAQPFLATPYRAMGYGGYQGYAAGSHNIRVFPNSTNIAVTSSWFVDTTLTFTANTYYTIVHVGLGRGTHLEDLGFPARGHRVQFGWQFEDVQQPHRGVGLLGQRERVAHRGERRLGQVHGTDDLPVLHHGRRGLIVPGHDQHRDHARHQAQRLADEVGGDLRGHHRRRS